MYSVVLDEQVLSLQYAEPEVTPEVQAVAQAGGAAITEITSGTITVNNPGDGTRGIELPQVLGTGASPTFANITTPGLADVSQLKVGGNETIKEIDFGTVAANPGSIAAQTRGSVDVTITGVRVGDIVLMNPPDGLNAGLVYGG
jgi:hypothetical protein